MKINNVSKMNFFKHIFTLIMLITIFSSMGISQEKFDLREKKNSHEISIGVADLLFKQQVYPIYPYYGMDMIYYPYPDYSYYNNNPKITLKYKYTFGKFALRAGFDFNYRSEENENNQNAYENETSNLYTLNKLGLEWQHDFKRSQLYFGVDVFTQYSKYKYSYDTYYYEYDENGDYTEIYTTSTTDNSNVEYGLSPFIGVKIFLNENISFGAETNYMFGNYKTKNSYTYIEESTNESEGSFARFGQIGLISLNVHF